MLNSEAAVIYDMICFSSIYFNPEVSISYIQRESGTNNKDELLKNYKSFLPAVEHKLPPLSVSLFFHLDGVNPCPMSRLWNNTVQSYQEFRDQIYCIPYLRKFMLSHYFDGLVGRENTELILHGDGAMIAKGMLLLIESLELDAKYFDVIYNLCYSFDNMVSDLFVYLDTLYEKMKKYHKDRTEDTNLVLENLFQDEEKQNLYRKSLSLDSNLNLQNQGFAVCYMQPYVQWCAHIGKNYLFYIGCYLLKYIENRVHYGYITATQSLQILGREHVDEIINILQKGPCTTSQISRKINLARTSVQRVLFDLADELVLISYKQGSEKYYLINYEYVAQARGIIIRYLDDMLMNTYNVKAKGR